MTGFCAYRLVRFAHCDPAGIAYYPRLFELCDSVIEDWTNEVLGTSRRELHLNHKLGLPTVTLEADFRNPALLGDELELELRIERVGNSSIDLILCATCAGEARFTVSYRQVLFEMESGRSRPWPDEWRNRLTRSANRETKK